MRIASRRALVVLALLAASTAFAAAPATAPALNLAYIPAKGADLTSTRAGAVNRGSADKTPDLSVVAPDEASTTLTDQPRLYWYISGPTDLPVEVALIDQSTDERVYDFSMKGVKGGFHYVDLAEAGVHLDANKRYELVVELVANLKDRSQDKADTGVIMRINPPAALAQNLAGAAGVKRADILLRAGVWYDGIADLMKQIEDPKREAPPDEASLVAARDKLLQDVGLAALAPARGSTMPAGGGAGARP